MKSQNARTKKLASLLEALDDELEELDASLSLQFDVRASLHDKLTASKRARTTLKKSRRLRDLLEQAIIEIDE